MPARSVVAASCALFCCFCYWSGFKTIISHINTLAPIIHSKVCYKMRIHSTRSRILLATQAQCRVRNLDRARRQNKTPFNVRWWVLKLTGSHRVSYSHSMNTFSQWSYLPDRCLCNYNCREMAKVMDLDSSAPRIGGPFLSPFFRRLCRSKISVRAWEGSMVNHASLYALSHMNVDELHFNCRFPIPFHD
jgi:hypothetical protein